MPRYDYYTQEKHLSVITKANKKYPKLLLTFAAIDGPLHSITPTIGVSQAAISIISQSIYRVPLNKLRGIEPSIEFSEKFLKDRQRALAKKQQKTSAKVRKQKIRCGCCLRKVPRKSSNHKYCLSCSNMLRSIPAGGRDAAIARFRKEHKLPPLGTEIDDAAPISSGFIITERVEGGDWADVYGDVPITSVVSDSHVICDGEITDPTKIKTEVCAECGRAFVTKRKRKYCVECSEERQRQNSREYYRRHTKPRIAAGRAAMAQAEVVEFAKKFEECFDENI